MTPASTRRGNREYRYYRCLKRDKEGSAGCAGGPMPAKGIEDFVVERLRHTLADGDLVGEIVGAMRERVTKTVAEHATEKRLLVEKIAQASSRVRNLTVQAEEGGVIGHARTALHERLEERGAELVALQERLERIERELAQLDDARVEADWLAQTLAEFDAVWNVLTPENQTRLVRAVVERVVVDEATGSVKMYVADLACTDVRGVTERVMSDAPRGQLLHEGVLSRRRARSKDVTYVPEPKLKEKLRPLRVARMLALAHECEALIAAGIVADRTELAGVLGFTKARVTQLLDLTLLAPNIQDGILVAEVEPGRDVITERALRAIVRQVDWTEQRAGWAELRRGWTAGDTAEGHRL
jgi:hypothetical protein